MGCHDLAIRIKKLKALKLHVFGHIHGGAGECDVNGVHFVNASICDEGYKAINPIREFHLQ